MSEKGPEKKSRKLLYIAAGVLLLLVVVGLGVVGYDAWVDADRERSQKRFQQFQEAQELERKKQEPGGSFGPNDFDATVRWVAGQQVAMREAEERKNEMAAKEAKLKMLHTLASVEGKPVQWQMSVSRVSATSVYIEPSYWLPQGKDSVHCVIWVGDDRRPPAMLHSEGFTIGEGAAVSQDQAGRLKSRPRPCSRAKRTNSQ